MSDRTNRHVGEPMGGGGLKRLILRLFFLAIVLAAGFGAYEWYVVRVEVPTNHVLVLVNKTGVELPSEHGDQVVLYPALVKALAAKTGWSEERVRKSHKGIQYEVLTEGRHFVSPIWYQRLTFPATVIEEGKFGVLIRKYGKPLPAGKTVATEPDERGVVAGTLPAGRHNINPLAEEVQEFKKIVIPEGWIGVQTLLSGLPPANPNEFVVQERERGVQPEVLGPGTYFDKNPFEVRIDLVDMRSHKYDMLGDEAIEFPSNDGFTIHMEATVEWALYADQAPWVTVEVGDIDDVVTKVIRPYMMSLARIQGSKMTARDFIGARETFQKKLFEDLRDKCSKQGVLIKAATVRDLKPPERVRSIIRERELADQSMTKYENEIKEAVERAKLVEQEELALQQAEIGDANKEVVSVTVNAEQEMAVAVTQANKRLDVARLALEAARKDAEAILSRGQADAKVVLFKYQAEAEPLRAAVAAFGDGYTYAQNQFYMKVAPAIRTILTNTDGPFSDIFQAFRKITPAGAAAPVSRSAAPPPVAPGEPAPAADEAKEPERVAGESVAARETVP